MPLNVLKPFSSIIITKENIPNDYFYVIRHCLFFIINIYFYVHIDLFIKERKMFKNIVPYPF